MERLKSHQDFTAVLKKRHKVSSSDVVVHFLVLDDRDRVHEMDGSVSSTAEKSSTQPLRRVGLAVTKSVGNAVKRNAVKRRFRVLAAKYENLLPPQCDIVIRAKSNAYSVFFSDLDEQISQLFARVNHKNRADKRCEA